MIFSNTSTTSLHTTDAYTKKIIFLEDKTYLYSEKVEIAIYDLNEVLILLTHKM